MYELSNLLITFPATGGVFLFIRQVSVIVTWFERSLRANDN